MKNPKAFICHSSKDHTLSEKLATDLRSRGIDAWYDKWEIKPGDSLRRKIEEGIEGADFFIVLLTHNSIKSEWVQTEIDAGLVRRIEGKCKFIPVLHEISYDELTPFLKTILHVRLDDDKYEDGLSQLASACLGRFEKPPLGEMPTLERIEGLYLSPNATKIAILINKRSRYGMGRDITIGLDEIARESGLSYQDSEEAIDELEDYGFVLIHKYLNVPSQIMPESSLFWETDHAVSGWNTHDDAVKVAGILVNSGKQLLDLKTISEELGWDIRRLNPAATYLAENGHATSSDAYGVFPYAYAWLRATAKTRRFLRENK